MKAERYSRRSEWALWYAEQVFPVFPCRPRGKEPLTAHGFKDATTDPKQIRQWWTQWPGANIGIPTGTASGLMVIDIDPRHGGDESWNALRAGRTIPKTFKQRTGGGGEHIFFRDLDGIRCGTLAPGVDVKAEGGYVIVSPSLHRSGERYTWVKDRSPETLRKPAPPPEWLLTLLKSARNGARADSPIEQGPWKIGERNTRLASVAGGLRRQGCSGEDIEAALRELNLRRCKPPLSEAEVKSIATGMERYKPAKGKRRSMMSSLFWLRDEGVFYSESDVDSEPLQICGRLEVVAVTRNANGECWGRLLKWRDAEGREHAWAMPMSLLSGDGGEYRQRLLDGGLIIAPGRKVRDLLTVYIQTAQPSTRALCVSQVGWHDDNFVLPDKTIGPEGEEPVLFQSSYEHEHLLSVAGTLEQWQEHVGRQCRGNSRLIFSASCAFAGSVLKPMDAESGGVHFVGPTSTGKTTALHAGGSVLGGGRNGFVETWRSTANALEAVAERHNDLTLFLDELAQVDPREASEIAYLLANGSGKQRMNRNITLRKKLMWRFLFVSAGEVTLSDHALTAGKRVRAGGEVRLLNIDADAGKGMGIFQNIHGAKSAGAFARKLKSAALRFYGTPLRAWLEFLVKDPAAAKKRLRTLQSEFLNEHVPPSASGEVSRAAQRFSLIGAAGELATAAGITGWNEGESTAAAVRCLRSWIRNRGAKGSSDAETAIQQVRRFLEAHGASRFQSLLDNASERIVNRAGFKRRHGGETQYLILPETFKKEVCAGYNYRSVAKELDARGFLVRGDREMTIKPRLPELGTARVYCIRAAILEGDE